MSHIIPRRSPTVFSDEFKRSAVSRLRKHEQTATDLALELGIRRNQLYKWSKKFEKLGPDEEFKSPGRPTVGELDDVTQLQRALAKAHEEIEILKKFDAYLTVQTK